MSFKNKSQYPLITKTLVFISGILFESVSIVTAKYILQITETHKMMRGALKMHTVINLNKQILRHKGMCNNYLDKGEG